jgi:hypothetical protein
MTTQLLNDNVSLSLTLRSDLGLLDWPRYPIYGSRSRNRADICFRYGLFSIFKCGDIPLEWYFGVSILDVVNLLGQ